MNAHGKGDDYDIIFIIMMVIKHERFKCIKRMNKGDELHDVSTYCMKFLKYMIPLDIELKAFAMFSLKTTSSK